jgi:hypothetical protein
MALPFRVDVGAYGEIITYGARLVRRSAHDKPTTGDPIVYLGLKLARPGDGGACPLMSLA